MSKNIINFIVTIILAYLLSLFLPWWSIMTAALTTALFIPLKKAAVFFIPFLAILLFWFVYSYSLSSGNDFTLAKRIAVLLPLGGNPYALMLVTGIVGGLAAGIVAVFGKRLILVLVMMAVLIVCRYPKAGTMPCACMNHVRRSSMVPGNFLRQNRLNKQARRNMSYAI